MEPDPKGVEVYESALRRVDLSSRLLVLATAGQAIDYLAGRAEFADRTRFPVPRLAILDLARHRDAGLEVLRWLRGQSPPARPSIVCLLASASDPDCALAWELGAHSCLVRAADPEAWARLVHLTLEYWLAFNLRPGDSI